MYYSYHRVIRNDVFCSLLHQNLIKKHITSCFHFKLVIISTNFAKKFRKTSIIVREDLKDFQCNAPKAISSLKQARMHSVTANHFFYKDIWYILRNFQTARVIHVPFTLAPGRHCEQNEQTVSNFAWQSLNNLKDDTHSLHRQILFEVFVATSDFVSVHAFLCSSCSFSKPFSFNPLAVGETLAIEDFDKKLFPSLLEHILEVALQQLTDLTNFFEAPTTQSSSHRSVDESDKLLVLWRNGMSDLLFIMLLDASAKFSRVFGLARARDSFEGRWNPISFLSISKYLHLKTKFETGCPYNKATG